MVAKLPWWLLILLFLAFGPADAQQQAPTHVSTRSPHGNLNIPCQNCHTFTGWKPIRNIPEFDHSKTRYPLRGMHVNVACTQCHASPVFTNVGGKCADCHADIHRRQMGAQCEQCHTVKGWHVSLQQVRDHQNRFPLLGAHAALDCDSCHKGAATGRFQGLSTECVACHINRFQTAQSPPHLSAGFPTQCMQCHTNVDTWLGAKFDHLKVTGFALSGMHATLECTACHVGGRYKGTPSNCVACHLKDYNGTNNPSHVKLGFPQTCSNCHNTVTWAGATFDHTLTGFPLTGAHVTAPCAQCHINGRYAGTPTQCSACHITQYNQTTNPNHAKAGFPQTCASCHNTTSWAGATFNHALTGFPLTGAHATVACAQCHINGRFAGTPTQCSACHIAQYNQTTSPNHAKAGFPTDCSICHSNVSWAGAKFDHSTTAFPLTGFHLKLQCSDCHASGVFKGLPTTCVSCHLNNYNKTTNPNHVKSGFPQQCEVCHSTSAWQPASFDHNKTMFPLTGFHTQVPCANCHIGGRYAGTPTDCYSCHKSVYASTTNPNHVAAGFPTTCQTCHNTSTWLGATFNHTWFLLPHHNAMCSDCHTNPSNYTVFVCTNCHTKGQTDPHHTDVPNYVYNSVNCYQCHKGGGGGG